ncbi:MAG: NAD+ synthase [Thiobacillaceae bacterium]
MKIALAQINPTVGDMAGNAELIRRCIDEAKAAGAGLLLTPEMSICGYPAEDLVLREDFCKVCEGEVNQLAAQTHGITVVVGYPRLQGDNRYNAAAVMRDAQVLTVYHKQKLPNHAVFDELRTFDPGEGCCIFDVDGVRFGINICGDIWETGPAELTAAAGARVLLVPNASPYHRTKQQERYQVARDRIADSSVALVYCNQIGGQDELVFDGASFAMNERGELTHQFPAWQEGLYYLTIESGHIQPGEVAPLPDEVAEVYEALKLGVRDYVGKNGFASAILGLSGGIDSALTLAVAVDALGAERVHAVMMPSEFTAGISLEDAREMVQTLAVPYSEITIKPVYEAFIGQLEQEFGQRPFDTTEENIQARIRGTLLMALSNKFGHIVLTTGNKSEMAVGYATLYGDMAGGFAVLKDVPKTLVYQLARYRNSLSRVIPQRIIDRPPSAELRPDQTDQDTLPPYDVLDAILERYVELDMDPAHIVEDGFDSATVKKVVRMIDLAEYKRRQSAPGVRITPRNFGKDRRYPITSKYRPEKNM